jgi:protein SCO1/2
MMRSDTSTLPHGGSGSAPTWAILGLVFAIALGLALAVLWTMGRRAELPVYGEVAAFTLAGDGGREVSSSELAGHVWVANFMFTRCRTICPAMSAEMARLSTDIDPELRLVSFTIDPEHDTPEVLAEYAERFGADRDRWFFLTGDKGTIYDLTRRSFHLGVVEAGGEEELARQAGEPEADPAPGGNSAKDPFIHSSRLVLVDRQGKIRGYYDSGDPERMRMLRTDARSLIRERS